MPLTGLWHRSAEELQQRAVAASVLRDESRFKWALEVEPRLDQPLSPSAASMISRMRGTVISSRVPSTHSWRVKGMPSPSR